MSIAIDRVKVQKAVEALLQEVIATGKTVCFFDINEFCKALKLSHLPKSKYHDVISDTLTFIDTHRKYGDWITCEYECEIRALIQLAKPGEKQSICDMEKNHFAVGADTIRKSFPVKKQKLTVDIPASLDPEAARKAIDATMAVMVRDDATLVDEDHDE